MQPSWRRWWGIFLIIKEEVAKVQNVWKFLNDLRPEVKQVMNYQGVHQFPLLVNICQIWDEDSRDTVAYYRSMGPMKNKKNGENHTWLLLRNMVIAPTIKGLLLRGLLVVVVANPQLSQLRSIVTSVVNQGTSPQIVPIKTWPISTTDKKGIFREIAYIARRSRMMGA